MLEHFAQEAVRWLHQWLQLIKLTALRYKTYEASSNGHIIINNKWPSDTVLHL